MVGPSGPGKEWKKGALCDALDQAVSVRTIEYWQGRKKVPTPENIYALIDLVSDSTTRAAWQERLVESARLAREARDAAKRRNGALGGRAKDAPIAGVIETEGRAGGSTDQARLLEPVDASPQSGTNRRPPAWSLVVGLVGIVAAGAAFAFIAQTRIDPITFCDEARFNPDTSTCTQPMDSLPAGSKRVYVTFRIHNFPEDREFTRTWFRNGQQIAERKGLLAPPWEHWTWLGAADPHASDAPSLDPGDYTLRVQAGGVVRSASFRMADTAVRATGEVFRDRFTKGDEHGPELVIVELPPTAGTTGNQVSAPRPDPLRLAIGRAPVSRADYGRCVSERACPPSARDRPARDGALPVTGVSWSDASAYVRWLNARVGFAPDGVRRFTLPTAEALSTAARSAALLTSDPSKIATSGSGLRSFDGPMLEWLFDCAETPPATAVRDPRLQEVGRCQTRFISRLAEADLEALDAETRRQDIGFRVARRLD
jgi:Sulfatase-modifying factor enzyme 1